MNRRTSTLLIYLFSAAATSLWVLGSLPQHEMGSSSLFFWLVFLAGPLLFAFAYPRLLFASSDGKNRPRFAFKLNAFAAPATLFLFLWLAALPYRYNPEGDAISPAALVLSVIALPFFLVAALSLLFRSKSALAVFVSVLLWPCILSSALLTLGRFYDESPLHSTYYFLCLASPILVAFAAGLIPYRPTFAHALTLCSGILATPWIYWTILRGSELENPWIMLNVPDKEVGVYPVLHARLTILAVALIALATVTAILRLLPLQWLLRKSPISDRTWPAYTASLLFLAIWFAQSVMPYRIPGAVDYADVPILQILHVEKRGVQFHETCISVYRSSEFYSSGNDRRLMQYRFQQKRSSGQLLPALMHRVVATVRSPDYAKRESTTIRPIREWNADVWYLVVESSGIHSYNAGAGTTPPQEVVGLFHDLETAPRSPETKSELKDVCLGFCYDPLSGLGYLYSNHRCFNAGQGTHCG